MDRVKEGVQNMDKGITNKRKKGKPRAVYKEMGHLHTGIVGIIL
jgi:hypothetical protein